MQHSNKCLQRIKHERGKEAPDYETKTRNASIIRFSDLNRDEVKP